MLGLGASKPIVGVGVLGFGVLGSGFGAKRSGFGKITCLQIHGPCEFVAFVECCGGVLFAV